MGDRLISTGIVIFIVLVGLFGFISYESNIVEAPLTFHAPISIHGNESFTLANGVTDGNGTQIDPFIIEGWDINASIQHGICIEDTDAYFIIRNCLVYNGRPDYNGVYLKSVSNGVVENINSTNNWNGIMLDYSQDNTISSNFCDKNSWEGIWLNHSESNTVIYNTCLNSQVGILVKRSSYNNVTVNDCSKSMEGIYLSSSSNNNIYNNDCHSNDLYGFVLYSSLKNIVKNNAFNNNDKYGIWIFSSSHENRIIYNNISDNIDYGIHLSDSDSNHIYHNNFINNNAGGVQAYDNAPSHFWNDSYPNGGNYWSDYVGVDNFKGPNQDDPGSDGIGDTNYSIDSGSVDYYPLMEPFLNPWIFLEEGWNLISIPRIQSNCSLDSILLDIQNDYNAIQYYNSSDINDPWKHFHNSKPSSFNDLAELNHKVGFWIYITKPHGVLFEYSGVKPSVNQTISLQKGWNLIGYPTQSNKNRTNALNNLTFGLDIDAIQWFDASTKSWHYLEEGDDFVLGRGYWIHAITECQWEVPL